MHHDCPTCGQPLPVPEGKRKCTGPCEQTKPLSAFHRLAHGKHGRRSRCRECTAAAQAKRAQVKPLIKRVKAPTPASKAADAQVAKWVADGRLAPATDKMCAYCKAPAVQYRKLQLAPVIQVMPVCAACAEKIAKGINIKPCYPEG